MSNVVNWFEIPAEDFERAVTFYQAILDAEMYQQEMGGGLMAFFPMDGEGVGGAVTKHEMMTPSATGTLVYLNGGDDLSVILDRVGDAGGSIVVPKTQVTEEIGFIAIFKDSEGNHVGLHSPN